MVAIPDLNASTVSGAIEKMAEHSGPAFDGTNYGSAEQLALEFLPPAIELVWSVLPSWAQEFIGVIQTAADIYSGLTEAFESGASIGEIAAGNTGDIVELVMSIYTGQIEKFYVETGQENRRRRWQRRAQWFEQNVFDTGLPYDWVSRQAELSHYLFKGPTTPGMATWMFKERNPLIFDPNTKFKRGTNNYVKWLLTPPPDIPAQPTSACYQPPDLIGQPDEGGASGACHGSLRVFPLFYPIWREYSLFRSIDRIPFPSNVGADDDRHPDVLMQGLQAACLLDPYYNLRVPMAEVLGYYAAFRENFLDLSKRNALGPPGEKTIEDFENADGKYGVWGQPQALWPGMTDTPVTLGGLKISNRGIRENAPPTDRFYFGRDGLIHARFDDAELDTFFINVNGTAWDGGGKPYELSQCCLRSWNTMAGAVMALTRARASWLSTPWGYSAALEEFEPAQLDPALRNIQWDQVAPGKWAPSDPPRAPLPPKRAPLPGKKRSRGGGAGLLLAAVGGFFLLKK